MKKNLLSIMASPRINGNSHLLLRSAIGKLNDFNKKTIILSKLKIAPCQNCGNCEKYGRCAISDDFQKVAISIERADAVLVCSPIYFYGVPAQFKALIDRSQAYWAKKYVLKYLKMPPRPVSTILVGGTKGKKMFLGSQLTLKYFYDVYNLESKKYLLIQGVDKKGEIKKYPAYLKMAEKIVG